MEDEIGWEIWEGETIEQKIKRKGHCIIKAILFIQSIFPGYIWREYNNST